MKQINVFYTKLNLILFLLSHLAISIMLSLLARLHNILDDESNMELNIDYMHLWPTSVSKWVNFLSIENDSIE